MTKTEPWRGLPPSVADVMEPELDAITDEILATIAREVPEYARPLEGAFGHGVRTGVTEALRQFVELIRSPSGERDQGREVYVALGRGELRQGRTLDSLQSAYRVGARVAWRRVADAARRADVDPEVLSLLAESIFAYIEELSADSVEGYAEARSRVEGERRRRQRELVVLLLRDPPADEADVRRRGRDGRLAPPALGRGARLPRERARPDRPAPARRRAGRGSSTGRAAWWSPTRRARAAPPSSRPALAERRAALGPRSRCSSWPRRGRSRARPCGRRGRRARGSPPVRCAPTTSWWTYCCSRAARWSSASRRAGWRNSTSSPRRHGAHARDRARVPARAGQRRGDGARARPPPADGALPARAAARAARRPARRPRRAPRARAGATGSVAPARSPDVGAQVDHEREPDDEPLEPVHLVAARGPHPGVGERRPGQDEEAEQRHDPAVERAVSMLLNSHSAKSASRGEISASSTTRQGIASGAYSAGLSGRPA